MSKKPPARSICHKGPCYSRNICLWHALFSTIIDIIQHKRFQVKQNPFHGRGRGRFPDKTFRYEKLMNIWRKGSSCCSCGQCKVWKSLRIKVVLPVKRISYFLHFSQLYLVYGEKYVFSFSYGLYDNKWFSTTSLIIDAKKATNALLKTYQSSARVLKGNQ